MLVKNTSDFQNYVFDNLGFTPEVHDRYTLYRNKEHPESGFCYIYRKKDCYELGIADYTIPKDFSITFHNAALQLRFGTMFQGKTHFRLHEKDVSSFTPSSFFVLEKDLKGQQAWKAGQHFHGIELTIYENYIANFVEEFFPDEFSFDLFRFNETYHYLPDEILSMIERFQQMHTENKLTPLCLEGMILECLGLLMQEMQSTENCFSTIAEQRIKIGKNRFLTFHRQDIVSIQKAHQILTEEYAKAPTIEQLSTRVLLPVQKLNIGFAHFFHMSIYDYILSLRMTHAAKMLQTSSESVETIASKVGYQYPANFIKMFKKYYKMTPLQFRKNG